MVVMNLMVELIELDKMMYCVLHFSWLQRYIYKRRDFFLLSWICSLGTESLLTVFLIFPTLPTSLKSDRCRLLHFSSSPSFLNPPQSHNEKITMEITSGLLFTKFPWLSVRLVTLNFSTCSISDIVPILPLVFPHVCFVGTIFLFLVPI